MAPMPSPAAALIAAVRARDTTAVERLIVAGAQVNTRDETGHTALGLAVLNADTAMCELLLANRADADLPCPGGLTPVMLAADGGAIGAWHALRGGSPDFALRDDLGRDAMDHARRWLGVDPADELRRRLGAVEGDGVETRRGPAPDEGTGSFEAVEVTTRNGTACVQTGHAAILTELEELAGIRLPFAELACRALAFEDPDHVGRFYPAMALAARVDDETFALAAEDLAGSPDPARRMFAAEVLKMYGMYKEEDGTAVRLEQAAVDVLRRSAVAEDDPTVLVEVVCGLGLHGEARTLPEILRHARHPAPAVRAVVAAALHGMIPPGDTEALRVIIALTQDECPAARRNAACVLSDHPADTPGIRAALARSMDDGDPDVAVEGARGLGLRDDPRADVPLVRAFLSRAEDSVPEVHRAYDPIRLWSLERFQAARDGVGPSSVEDRPPAQEPRP